MIWSGARGSQRERVLVIAPHPDDEVLGCGGTIARLTDAGHEVTTAIVTATWEPLFPSGASERVREETRAAAELLGVARTEFLGLPVVKLDQLPEYELNAALERLISAVSPTLVFLPFLGDRHEDHRQVFDAAMVALRPLASRRAVHTVLCYETISETHWSAPYNEAAFQPQVFVDVEATLERKIAAMRCYASQLQEPPGPRSLTALEALARWRGSTVSMVAAEAFVVVRHCVVS